MKEGSLTMSPKWTQENIQKLLVSLRNNIPADKMSGPYFRAVKAVDWNKVAFPPFSPSACRVKWMRIMYKVQKSRTLTEIIDAAADVDNIPMVEYQGEEQGEDSTGQIPARNAFILFCNERQKTLPDDAEREEVGTDLMMWKSLTNEQRNEYRERCRELSKKNKAPKFEKDEKWVRKKRFKEGGYKGEPEIPSKTAFSTFFQDQIKLQGKNLLVGRSNKMDQLQDVSKKWFDLPDSEKEVYKQKLQQNLKKYSNELREWFEKLCPSAKEDFLFCYPEKKKYLDAGQTQVNGKKDPPRQRPMDPEDQDIESSSSSSDEFVDSEGEELEGDGQGDIFECF